MEYDKEDNGFISVPAPEFGAIFMSNVATKRLCLKHKLFGLPSSMANFVKEVKKGMVLFLFEYERRQLFGVYQAISDGEMNIIPHAFSSSGKQFSAQVQFMPIWYCSPLSENEFRDAIRENYFSAKKFHFGLSDEQVRRLLRLFSSRKLKDKLPPRNLTTAASNRVDEYHIEPSNVDLGPSLSKGYPRSFRGVKRAGDDMCLIEHRVEDEDKVDTAEHVYYNDKKRRIGYDGRLLRENAAEDKIYLHPLTEEIVFSGDDWSFDDRVKSDHKFNMNYTPVISSYMRDSDHKRTADDANIVMRAHIVNGNNMNSSFCLGRSNEHHGKASDNGRTRLGTHHSGFIRNNTVDKAHSMDNSQEPALSRRKKSDPIWNIGTLSDDRQRSLDDKVGKKSHLDPDTNYTIVSERFVNSPYNLKGICKDGRLFTREISGKESTFRTGLGRGSDHEAATDDVRFLSRRKGANENCVDSFLIRAASNGNSPYAGDAGRQVAEAGSYPMNDFNGLVPGTEDSLTFGEGTAYSPVNKRTSGYSSKFLTEFPQSTEAQNPGPSCSKFHDATITRVMPYKDEFPSSCYGHTSTYEVEKGSNFVQKRSSYYVNRENIFAPSKGLSTPYSYPEFTKRCVEPASEDGKKVQLRLHDEFNNPSNVGISEAVEPNKSASFGYTTAFIPMPSITQHFSRDNINEGATQRLSSQAALGSNASHSSPGNYQYADEEQGGVHVVWQGSDGTNVGRRSLSPNTSWLLHQRDILTNLDHASSPGAGIVNDEYEDNILTEVVHSESRKCRRSVFSRLSSAPKVCMSREQQADRSMSYDEYHMDTTIDEIMDKLYQGQNIVPKNPLKRKPFVRKIGYGETNMSGKHAAVVRNPIEQPDELMMKVLIKGNKVVEETVNHVLAETRVVDFKRRRETNQASGETNAKFNNEEKTKAAEHAFSLNAQENISETKVAKDSADKASKRRKLVRPAFDENNSSSDFNHQLPCQTHGKVSTGNSGSSELQSL